LPDIGTIWQDRAIVAGDGLGRLHFLRTEQSAHASLPARIHSS
jgi:hypothetical protein